jgi:hypothetical protein
MFPKDEIFVENYKLLMSLIKINNQRNFWSSNLKRRVLKSLKQKNVMSKFVTKISPYDLSNKANDGEYFSKERIAVYTSIFNGYDILNEPYIKPDNCDFYVITDSEQIESSVWKRLKVNLHEFGLENKSGTEINRFFKMLPHKIFHDYKYSIYVDGNIKIMTDLTEFIQDINMYGFKMHGHYRQNCIYKEISKCIKLKKDTYDNLSAHMRHLVNEKMPKNYGLLEAGIIVRKHKNENCVNIMEQWWMEFTNYSKRDQISLPYILWKNGIKINDVNGLGKDLSTNYAFQKKTHR